MKGPIAAVCCATLLAVAPAAQEQARPRAEGQAAQMNGIAERYVKLVLAVGRHDADYVDAYYGPPEWKKESEGVKVPLGELASRAKGMHAEAAALKPPDGELERLRARYLERQLSAVTARLRMLQGERLSFDEESRALYDAVAPTLPESHFQAVLDQLDQQFPGAGALVDRYDAFRRAFVIPKEKHDAVFQAAIRGCRERTLTHLALPPDEQFTLEYVTNKSWSGYIRAAIAA
jgi:hypothetical protein